MRLRRFLVVLIAALAFAAPAGAWTWPASGPVLLPFSFDPSHPYSAGQHRGIDIGGTAGETVFAPAAGVVTFAGTVPGSGKSVTILTSDGWSVTLTELGSIAVAKGATVAEGDGVGTLGPGGDPDVSGPYVQLGVRRADQDQGYVDPMTLLPARVVDPPPPVGAPDPTTTDGSATTSAPVSTSPGDGAGVDAAPAPASAPASVPPLDASVTAPAAPVVQASASAPASTQVVVASPPASPSPSNESSSSASTSLPSTGRAADQAHVAEGAVAPRVTAPRVAVVRPSGSVGVDRARATGSALTARAARPASTVPGAIRTPVAAPVAASAAAPVTAPVASVPAPPVAPAAAPHAATVRPRTVPTAHRPARQPPGCCCPFEGRRDNASAPVRGLRAAGASLASVRLLDGEARRSPEVGGAGCRRSHLATHGAGRGTGRRPGLAQVARGPAPRTCARRGRRGIPARGHSATPSYD